jgi:hypothetical protein
MDNRALRDSIYQFGPEGSGTRQLRCRENRVGGSRLSSGLASVASTRPQAEKDECARAHSNNSERSERQIRRGAANFFFTKNEPQPLRAGARSRFSLERVKGFQDSHA